MRATVFSPTLESRLRISHTSSFDIDSAQYVQCGLYDKCWTDACGGEGCALLSDVGCTCKDGTILGFDENAAVSSSALVMLAGMLLAMVA